MEKKALSMKMVLIAVVVIGGIWFYYDRTSKLDDAEVLDRAKNKGLFSRDKEEQEEPKGPIYSWIVESKFDYEYIWLCCDGFIASYPGGDGYIDEKTGELIGGEHYGHGGGSNLFAYNSTTKKYGWYESDEGQGVVDFTKDSFEEIYKEIERTKPRYFDYVSNIFPVIQIDTPKSRLDIESGDEWEDFGWPNKYAYATKDGIVTEFIFDTLDGNRAVNMPAVAKGSYDQGFKWGVIDNDGKQIIDFIFEDAISIDDETAFVKLDGKWGIIKKK